jgi:hypothetical protein
MSDESLALSTIPPRPPAEDDYDLICATMMGSGRGRWFLDEYARRNRSADTALVLAAIERLEAVLRDTSGLAADRGFIEQDSTKQDSIRRAAAEDGAVPEIVSGSPPGGNGHDAGSTLAKAPSEMAPPEVTPPEMTPPEVTPPEMTPPEVTPPAVASPDDVRQEAEARDLPGASAAEPTSAPGPADATVAVQWVLAEEVPTAEAPIVLAPTLQVEQAAATAVAEVSAAAVEIEPAPDPAPDSSAEIHAVATAVEVEAEVEVDVKVNVELELEPLVVVPAARHEIAADAPRAELELEPIFVKPLFEVVPTQAPAEPEGEVAKTQAPGLSSHEQSAQVLDAQVLHAQVLNAPAVAAQDLAQPDLAQQDLAQPDLAQQDSAQPDLAQQDLAQQDLAQAASEVTVEHAVPAASEPAPQAPPSLLEPVPQPAPNDPLAALKAMSFEERIALFT